MRPNDPRGDSHSVWHDPVDRDPSNAEVVQIDSFEVESPGGLKMGDEVTFTLRGTPGGEAVVLVTGIPEQVYLEEIDEGLYSGSLRIHPHMRFFPHDFARATLERGQYSASADQKLPLEY